LRLSVLYAVHFYKKYKNEHNKIFFLISNKDPLMNSFKSLKEIRNETDIDLIEFAASVADIMAPITSPNNDYSYQYIFTCLFDFVEKCTSWTKYKGTIDCPIKGTYLNEIHHKLENNGIYKEINRQYINKYLKKGKEEKLKYQIIDSSFIPNKGGSVKNNNHLLSDKVKKKNRIIRKENKKLPKKKQKKEETFIDFNKYNGRKKYFKISTLTDSYGTPLTTTVVSSKQSDNISVIETINSLPINLNTLRNSKVNRYKQTILADSSYNSEHNKTYLKKIGYTPIIDYNKRNTKNKELIKKNKLNRKEKKIYKKRKIIESFFSWIKNFPVINQNYQKTIKSYNGLLLLASSLIISKKIKKLNS
jgi:hypothetical protein